MTDDQAAQVIELLQQVVKEVQEVQAVVRSMYAGQVRRLDAIQELVGSSLPKPGV